MKMKTGLALLLVCLLMLGMAACSSDPASTNDPKNVRELTKVVTADTISELENYSNLKKADLTGSTCYQEIAAYAAKHPEVEVIYTVDMGGITVGSDIASVSIADGLYDYETLLTNLKYLPNLTSLSLPATRLTAAQVDALRQSCPGVQITCTIMLNGVELGADTTELNLSTLTADQVDAYAAKLGLLPNLAKVELMATDGTCKLTLEDVKKLQAAAPNAVFSFSFELFGKTISTADEKVEFVNVEIGNEGEQDIRDALDLLTNCTYFLLDNCGLDNEVLADIRDDYPNTKIVWRVFQTNKNRSWLTDTEVLRAVYGIDDTNSGPLKYLTEVKYVDLGHNEDMVDISFLGYMPNLEIAILSGSPIVDLSPLANCKKLEFLELAWCGLLTDVSPLAQCDSLKYLNLGHTKVKDLSVLKDLPLEQLSYVNSGNKVGMTEADWQAIQAQHPDCWITYEPLKDSSATPYSKGWRYNNDNTYTACYKKVREVFDYDSIDQVISGGASTPTGNAAVKKVTKVVTADTISQLEQYPNLEEADLTGSTCYEAIKKYMAAHPGVDVTYNVSLGGSITVKNTTTDLSLKHGSYDYNVLAENLKYVSSLKNLSFPSTSLTADQIGALKSGNPGVSIKYTMATQGTQVGGDISAVDLSAMTADQVGTAIEQLKAYPNVVWVELMKSSGGSNLSISDVKKLQTACPNVIFHYSFDLFGKTVSTTDETIEYKNVSIGNSGETKIRAALDILSGCTYFKLDNCGLSNEVLAKIRDDYPRTKVVWRVYQTNKGRSWLTDTTVLRAVYGINDSNSGVLKYCTEVKYMDLGHNTEMVDISFCAYMPNLEIAILSGAPIKDLSPLANCKKLEFLELAWCGHVSNVAPLAGCDSLKYLNVGHTKVKDFSALKGLKLEMLSYVNSGNRVGFTEAHWEEIQAMFPGCWITFNPLFDNNATPYSKGWRYKQNGGYTDIYRKVRDVFGYDEIDKVLQSQG